jgi:hypothetical protein
VPVASKNTGLFNHEYAGVAEYSVYNNRVVWKLAGNFVARTVSKQQPQNTFVRL